MLGKKVKVVILAMVGGNGCRGRGRGLRLDWGLW